MITINEREIIQPDKMSFEKKANSLINEICKLLLINGSFSTNYGLATGQTGAIIFLYNYESYKEEEIFYNYANELTLNILSNLDDNNIPLTYADGLTGIGIALNHLIKNNYIEVGTDFYVLNDIDSKILKDKQYLNLGLNSISASLYLKSRLSEGSKNYAALEMLLKQERLVDHIDAVDDMLLFSDLLDTANFFDNLNRNNGALFLVQLIDKLSNAAHLLSELFEVDLNRQIKENVIDRAYTGLKNYLIHFFDLVSKQHAIIYDQKELVKYLLFKLYNSFLKISVLLRYDLLEMEFLETWDSLNQHKDHERKEGSFQSGRRIPALIYLAGIEQLTKNTAISDRFQNEITYILDDFFDQEFELSVFLLKDSSLNIGVSGLSGLGLILLDSLSPLSVDWNEKLFIC